MVELLRGAADVRDSGAYGDGVEVVVESPRPGWWADLFGRADHVQARIIVTKVGGDVSYPFDVHLIADGGGRAAHRAGRGLVGPGRGWATSVTAGEAFLVRKGRPDEPPDWLTLAAGTLAAMKTLAGRVPDRGWKVRVDRALQRA